MRLTRRLFAGLALALAATTASAQDYPTQPVNLLVPFSAGGGSDTMARMLGAKLSEKWGQNVLVENKPGASTTIASAYFVKQPADGYHLFLGPPPWLTAQYVYDNLGYTTDDFDPISLVAVYPMLLVVPKDSDIQTLDDLIAKAKANPGMTYPSPGAGSTPHLMGALLAQEEGLDLVHVPYSSGGPATVDLIAGRTDFYPGHPTEVMSHVKEGTLRPIAVLSDQRLSELPDVPTSLELGYEKLQVSSWSTILAPKGTPEALRAKIAADIKAVTEDPDFASAFTSRGAIMVGSTPEELAAFITSEHAKFGPLIKAIGLKPAGQ